MVARDSILRAKESPKGKCIKDDTHKCRHGDFQASLLSFRYEYLRTIFLLKFDA
ncbi:MAG: hypothetical protein ACI9FD_004388 [Gammaproteobacteria bacterium]|jgi:hypothetical protein